MNHWISQQIPYNYNKKNVTVQWYGTDTETALSRNPDREKWNRVKIAYQFNAQGFRTHDLVEMYNKKVDIALGCSFAQGVGMPVEFVWPALIEKKSQFPMLNLGYSGGSGDSVARILTNICGLYQIQTVYILWPDLARFELYTDDGINTVQPMNPKIEYAWNMEDSVAVQRFYQNQSRVALLSEIYKFRVKQLTVQEFNRSYSQRNLLCDVARDGLHYGFESNQEIAEILLTTK
jgi:hypothetical protein